MKHLTNNFWKDYPELTIAPGLDKLYSSDKSKGKEKSSQIMWAIDLCENLDSKFYHNPNKYELVAKTVLKDEKFKWKAYEDTIEFYRECCLSDAERSLTTWNETMKLRSRSIKEMYQDAIKGKPELNEEGAPTGKIIKDTKELLDLDKMLAATPKMFDDYKKIKADYDDEKKVGKGKRIGSISDNDDV